jgi:hypothetical protein
VANSLEVPELTSHGEPGSRLAALRAAIDFYRDKPTATSNEVVEAATAYPAFLTERREPAD